MLNYSLHHLYASCPYKEVLDHGIHYYTSGEQYPFLKSHLCIHFILPIFIFLFVIFPISCWLFYGKSTRRVRKVLTDNLLLSSSLIYIIGFILYFIGYTQSVKGETALLVVSSALQALGRALVSAFGMFIPETDFIEVGEAYHHNIFYLAAYSITHLLGMLISVFVIIKLIGRRIISRIEMCWISFVARLKKKDIFVFWGINEESITLAESINEKFIKDKKGKRNIELLFVETPSEKEFEFKEHSLSHVFSSYMYGSSENDRIEELGGIILYPKRRLIDVAKEISDSGTGENHFEKLGLNKLAKLCKSSTMLKIFLFSDNQKKNIQDTLILKELFEKDVELDKKEIHLYSRARKNEVNMVFEEVSYLNGKNKVKVHIIDDSSLSVLSLKMEPKYHPVQYVHINERALVTSEFNALILGFGQTGRDAFRFLYEFGTFPGIGSEHEERSPLHITAIDKNMNEIEAIFRSKCPALFQNHNKDRFELSSCDINSKDFFEQILLRNNNDGTKLIQNLNYVVVALGDDKTNLSVAMNLYRLIMRYKSPNAPRFTIYVRVYGEDSMREAQMIQNHTKNDNENRIELFGNPKKIYTYDIIVNDKVLKDAQIFAYIYDNGVNQLNSWNENFEKDAKTSWDKKCNVREEEYKTADKSKEAALNVIRQVEQDMSNSLHVQTKIHLIKQTNIEKRYWNSWPDKRVRNTYSGEILSPVIYYVFEKEQVVIDNVALCEHLRWNALSELQGFTSCYTPPSDFPKNKNYKDHIKKELECLRPWKKELQGMQQKDTLYYGRRALRGTMPYDYNALDTSIYMDKHKM